MNLSLRRARLTTGTALLLLIVFSRMRLMQRIEFHIDEIWSVWSTLGTLPETLAWVPFDWPPLYAVWMWLWQTLTGIHPVTLRWSALLMALIAFALLFRISRRLLQNDTAAWLSTLAFAAFGYSLTLSLFVRGYVLMMPLFMLIVWFTLAYFERPTFWKAAGLALSMAALFYTNLAAVAAFLVPGLLSLVLFPRKIGRWWLPGGMAFLLALPEIISKLDLALNRHAGTIFKQPTFLGSMEALYADLFGQYVLIWLALIAVAAGLLLWRDKQRYRRGLLFALWGAGFAVLMYLVDDIIGFFTPRQVWWILPGIALLIGAGLRYLPRVLRAAAAGMMLILMLITPYVPTTLSYIAPYEEFFSQLASRWQAGDVLMIDPDCRCGHPMRYDYYQRVFFPDGLPLVTEPGENRRIWYLGADGAEPPPTLQLLQENYVQSEFLGPPELLFQLYEAPPNPDGVLFENGMRFHGLSVLNNATPSERPVLRHEGEAVRVRLWWSVDETPARDYSISLQLIGRDGLVAQVDGAPQTVTLQPYASAPPPEISRWQPGRYYIEERTLYIPNPTPAGEYGLSLIVYQWWDGVRVPPQRLPLLPPLRTIHVMSW